MREEPAPEPVAAAEMSEGAAVEPVAEPVEVATVDPVEAAPEPAAVEDTPIEPIAGPEAPETVAAAVKDLAAELEPTIAAAEAAPASLEPDVEPFAEPVVDASTPPAASEVFAEPDEALSFQTSDAAPVQAEVAEMEASDPAPEFAPQPVEAPAPEPVDPAPAPIEPVAEAANDVAEEPVATEPEVVEFAPPETEPETETPGVIIDAEAEDAAEDDQKIDPKRANRFNPWM